MNLKRIYRTVKHLTSEQWYYRFICRGKRIYMHYFPDSSWKKISIRASKLPFPNLESPQLHKASRHIELLQSSLHDHLEGINSGRFTFLNKTIDFEGVNNISWRKDLGEGNNPLWRMNLSYMGYAVPMLARGRRKEFETILTLLRSLDTENPWSEKGVFRDVWFPYAVSHRLINLLCALALYKEANGEATPEEYESILKHIRFCAVFVLQNLERELQFNHLLKNYVSLTLYCASIGRVPSAFRILKHGVPKSINQQILDDGGHAERSPMYHLLSILDLRILMDSDLFRKEWNPLLVDKLLKMEKALQLLSHIDGDIALFNDSWLGEGPISSIVSTGSTKIGKTRLPVTGYVRLADGEDLVLFDCGSCGPDENPGHAHADFLSVEVSVKGSRFIVDPGVPTYTAGPLRDISRSASRHNGPHLSGNEPVEFWKSFRVGRRGMAREIVQSDFNGLAPMWCGGFHTGYEHIGVKVKRFVGLWPGQALLIADLLTGKGILNLSAASNFLVNGDWEISYNRSVVFKNDTCEVSAKILVGSMSPVTPSCWWPRFGVEFPAHLISVIPAEVSNIKYAVSFFKWSKKITEPSTDKINRLFRLLSTQKSLRK